MGEVSDAHVVDKRPQVAKTVVRERLVADGSPGWIEALGLR